MERCAAVALGAVLVAGCSGVDESSRHYQAGLQGGRGYAYLADPRDECEQFAQLYAKALSGRDPSDADAIGREAKAGCLAGAEAA
jgi:hypothetical protein